MRSLKAEPPDAPRLESAAPGSAPPHMDTLKKSVGRVGQNINFSYIIFYFFSMKSLVNDLHDLHYGIRLGIKKKNEKNKEDSLSSALPPVSICLITQA